MLQLPKGTWLPADLGGPPQQSKKENKNKHIFQTVRCYCGLPTLIALQEDWVTATFTIGRRRLWNSTNDRQTDTCPFINTIHFTFTVLFTFVLFLLNLFPTNGEVYCVWSKKQSLQGRWGCQRQHLWKWIQQQFVRQMTYIFTDTTYITISHYAKKFIL